jgi:hypothetical protein
VVPLTGVVLFMALLTTAEGAIYAVARGAPVSWGPLFGLRLLDWSTCALFVPPLYVLVTRLPLTGREKAFTPFALLLASLVAALLKYSVHTPLAAIADPANARSISAALQSDFLAKVFFYWAVIAGLYAFAGLRNRLSTPPEPLVGQTVAKDRLVQDRGHPNEFPSPVFRDDIVWVEAQGNYCTIHSTTGRRMVRRTLTSLLDELAPEGFVRIHKSRLVKRDCVRGLQTRAGRTDLVMSDGVTLRCGRAFEAPIRDLFGRLSHRR